MDGFKSWATKHCTAFGLGEGQWPTVATWEPYFDAAGFTAAQLSEATGWLLLNAPPKYVGDHPSAIGRRVRLQRAVDLEARTEDDIPRCVKCGGYGTLSVPHLIGIRSGHWVGVKRAWSNRVQFYTCAVRCDCAKGQFLNCVNRKGEPMLGVADYEAANPDWRKQMAQRDRELAEESRLAVVSDDGPQL